MQRVRIYIPISTLEPVQAPFTTDIVEMKKCDEIRWRWSDVQ